MIYIIDSGILINQSVIPDLHIEDEVVYTTQNVLNELKSSLSRSVLILFEEKYKITVINPSLINIDSVKKTISKIGENKLSMQDIELLALAVELRNNDMVIIFTDDYAIMNIAHELEITVNNIKTTGGSQKRRYKFKCKSCGKYYNREQLDCEICGSQQFIRYKK
ncbi:MAG: hypothetical protein OEY49_02250 [Candidatus Heimdallarchaeota archaeon]|nr:hypothetical protein [Candidatus Heimdallarchaeota archaeon]